MIIKDAKRVARELLLPLVAYNLSGSHIVNTLDLFDKYSLSYYDASIVGAALDTGCDTIYSEDMQNGADYDGVTVVNPFI